MNIVSFALESLLSFKDLGKETDKVSWSLLQHACTDEDIDTIETDEAETYKHGLH